MSVACASSSIAAKSIHSNQNSRHLLLTASGPMQPYVCTIYGVVRVTRVKKPKENTAKTNKNYGEI